MCAWCDSRQWASSPTSESLTKPLWFGSMPPERPTMFNDRRNWVTAAVLRHEISWNPYNRSRSATKHLRHSLYRRCLRSCCRRRRSRHRRCRNPHSHVIVVIMCTLYSEATAIKRYVSNLSSFVLSICEDRATPSWLSPYYSRVDKLTEKQQIGSSGRFFSVNRFKSLNWSDVRIISRDDFIMHNRCSPATSL